MRLTAVHVGEMAVVSNLFTVDFTVDPADQAAPIHVEIKDDWGESYGPDGVIKSTATCRAMLITAIGVQMEGCSGSDGTVIPLYWDSTHWMFSLAGPVDASAWGPRQWALLVLAGLLTPAALVWVTRLFN